MGKKRNYGGSEDSPDACFGGPSVASSELPPELAASRNLRRNLRRRRSRRRSESAAPKPSLFSRAGAGESFARILRSVPCRGPAQKELYVRATQ